MRTLIVALFLVSCCTPSARSIFFGRRAQQLCVNAAGLAAAAVPPGQLPPPGSGTQVACVKCDSNRLQYISAVCTGQPNVPPNITPNQGFCLISNCLQQIPQKNSVLPSFGGTGMMGYPGNNMPIGRKRRAAGPDGTQPADDVIRTSIVSGEGISLKVDPQNMNE